MALCLLSFHIPVHWLKPEIELVSRDRGGDYASAAATGAPQARQCADRFHVLKNLSETLEGVLARHLATHRRGQAEKSSVTPLSDAPSKQPPFLSSKGSPVAAGEARGTPFPIPARYHVTKARLLADSHRRSGWHRPCHCLALVGSWSISRTTTASAYDRS